MRVLVNRLCKDGWRRTDTQWLRWVVGVPPLATTPAVVCSTPIARAAWAEVDLLPGVLPDLSDCQVTCLAVKREAPGVTEAIRPDLGLLRRLPHEWVIRWNRVGLTVRPQAWVD